MPVVLETVGLEKHFGGIAAVAGVSLKIEKGARHALIGPNGAGKTTVINLLTGVLRPSAGRILLEGQDITALEASHWWRLIGTNPQVVEEIVEILARFHLTDVMYERTGNLPYGKQRLLEIALAIACRPHVLLLDEPAAGVPEDERHEILATVAALPGDVTVLLIEHDMDIVFSFADRISVLVNGALFVDGAPEEVARDPRVKAVYLGESLDA
ncbi:MAG: branched-chain amino acid ABC transporter ATP-binding protein [Alphaproteobacteria bacterium 13_2_20CM_2_64_7]|nr:MAG: branched-chain amino acid ABC transporter ATP-binding protein [Alphaproteobacteria bacterium 13_2_20CM_2_64_7]